MELLDGWEPLDGGELLGEQGHGKPDPKLELARMPVKNTIKNTYEG